MLNTTLSELSARNSASEKACQTANENLKMVSAKCEKLKRMLCNARNENEATKSKLVKEIRNDQLVTVKDKSDAEIILGRGKFGKCKLMKMSVSGESILVAAKQYCNTVKREHVIQEAILLSQLSHPVFPFVFGAVFSDSSYMLILEFCGVSEGKMHSLTVYAALHSKAVCLTEKSWLKILFNCCGGFNYLHTVGIIHNDIKTDNILVVQDVSGLWHPKIIDFNKAVHLGTSRKRDIPFAEQIRLKQLYKHVDPALYEGLYAPCPSSDVYSFGYMASQIARFIKSELVDKISVTCMTKYLRPSFGTLERDMSVLYQ